MSTRARSRAFTLIELLVVVMLLALMIGILMPSLSAAKRRAAASKMNAEAARVAQGVDQVITPMPPPPAALPLARISAFDAKIELTPRLSVGTIEAESIYEAKFIGKVRASASSNAENQIVFPLPPQIISLGDLTLKINGEPSDRLQLHDGKLLWQGKLPEQPVDVELTYAAVGKGVYALEVPPGGILDSFNIDLATVGSDVRMLELSLQPTHLERLSGKTLYAWNYKHLLFGRPIALDVLGIAPIDRLGELTWLGPLSIVMFGLMVGLIARAYPVANFDRWMLILIIGTFTGAYPLMYFAQEFASPTLSILVPAALVILIIAFRAMTLMGAKIGILGITLPASSVMTFALTAALYPRLQGILLTIATLALFIVAMTLAPRLKLRFPGRQLPPTPNAPPALA